MDRFIPYKKLSKKQKKLIDASKRGSWGNVNPTERKTENKKAYNRKKLRRDWDETYRAFLYLNTEIQIKTAC